jgi:hypothetical protein
MAQRRAGELIRDLPEKLKGRPAKGSSATRLSDLGISADQSSKWQGLAKVSQEKFESMWNECDERGDELTQAHVWRRLRWLLSRSDYDSATKAVGWGRNLLTTEADNAAKRISQEIQAFTNSIESGRLSADMRLVTTDRRELLRWEQLGLTDHEQVHAWEEQALWALAACFSDCRHQIDRCLEALHRRLDGAQVSWRVGRETTLLDHIK